MPGDGHSDAFAPGGGGKREQKGLESRARTRACVLRMYIHTNVYKRVRARGRPRVPINIFVYREPRELLAGW